MKIPVLTGIIRRRFLLNFRINPEVLKCVLPPPFSPRLYKGYGIGGLCLIRLEKIRPRFLPSSFGIASENAAHRFMVCWPTEDGGKSSGVYLPRRDTNSLFNHLAGGRIFPGQHHKASFDSKRQGDEFDFSMVSSDGQVSVAFQGVLSDSLPEKSVFSSMSESSKFFEEGSRGYSPLEDNKGFDGMILKIRGWAVRPIQVKRISSSYFDDQRIFPKGSIEFDHALFMENIEHEWQSADCLYGTREAPVTYR